ncbi:MAG TPA: hypothetical protein VHJ83_06610 [Micromonosporaceae bacterium]|nr:hypothetical protein [Micromonosporaceae bacterium]
MTEPSQSRQHPAPCRHCRIPVVDTDTGATHLDSYGNLAGWLCPLPHMTLAAHPGDPALPSTPVTAEPVPEHPQPPRPPRDVTPVPSASQRRHVPGPPTPVPY